MTTTDWIIAAVGLVLLVSLSQKNPAATEEVITFTESEAEVFD